ncbi:hypothetical protein T310_3678 [Rasamsonia emersonii CBS 393.64]|uniref:Uncharacterized protein n=1 Tax=Rasamsonia emersonii (strain ATCC 16479 / CBS 393.64 / IMI 116815) TaxID=1408163 RepID=A0A0F4YWS1_RASE3|nr:hypothetical protein T310_3678 [Rasamsonia emersonii CBS 393.64]KKA22286.1 hypothetical protein T310_3678 [Rasamsonia emersonii CBS 393.64]
MVYDWEGKREICYQMYIKDRKALEEIMEYMKNTHQFAPSTLMLSLSGSKRAFQTQFKRWGFPSKQNPAHKNPALVARIKELWERNTSQREMLRILNEEGYNIKERELMRVRAKNRWLLRVPNGMKSQTTVQSETPQPVEEGLLALQQEIYKQEPSYGQNQTLTTQPSNQHPLPPGLSPEILAKRKERLERLQAESAERWATRKRRRRTRGWAGLPADPPGRHVSHQRLQLMKFQKICEEAGFIKKTVAGPERWQEAKNKLIRESPHLQSVFSVDPNSTDTNQLDAKALALDIVCTDVTKRMRTLERRMTIAEAKNALGINPEESRQIRNAFYNTLKANHFTSKLEAGDEHWRELKERWIQGSPLLQRILAPGAADPEHATKVKAIEVLCRDVMKRLRDDQTKRDPSRKRSAAQQNNVQTTASNNIGNTYGQGINNGISTLASQALASAPMVAGDIGEMQIDPSLLQAANNPSFATSFQQNVGQSFNYVDPLLGSAIPPVPVYIRISPESEVHGASKTWVEKLTTRSVAELRELVSARYPDSIPTRIEGIEKDETGNEVSFLIDEDHELDAYLTHMHGKKAAFVVRLNSIQ